MTLDAVLTALIVAAAAAYLARRAWSARKAGAACAGCPARRPGKQGTEAS